LVILQWFFLFQRNNVRLMLIPVWRTGILDRYVWCDVSRELQPGHLSLNGSSVATGFVRRCHRGAGKQFFAPYRKGMQPFQAASSGRAEVASRAVHEPLLIAVFIHPAMGVSSQAIREFAVTLSAAILVSLVVSLTTTPICVHAFSNRR